MTTPYDKLWTEGKLPAPDSVEYVVVIPRSAGLAFIRAVEHLARYIGSVCGAHPFISLDDEFVAARYSASRLLIVIGWKSENRVLHTIPFDRARITDDSDAYTIQTLRSSRNPSTVVIYGADETAARYGLWEFLRLLSQVDATLVMPETHVIRRPMTRYRVASLCWFIGLHLSSPELARRYAYENWPVALIHDYIDLLDQFGFNAVEQSDQFSDYICSGSLVTRTRWRKKLLNSYGRARELGWRTMLRVWSNSIYDHEREEACIEVSPRTRRGRAAIDDYYGFQASYATLLDDMTFHCADPGGGGTVEDLQDIALTLLSKARAVNPALRMALLTWGLVPGSAYQRWQGFTGVDSLHRLPGDVGIVLESPLDDPQLWWFRDEPGRDFVSAMAAGRRVGVWAYRFCDYEEQNALHVHLGLMEQYFKLVPTEPLHQLDFHTLDVNHHGLHLPNLYVAAQMLWDPSKNIYELLDEYCVGQFGPRCGKHVALAYRVIDAVRCSPRLESQAEGHGWGTSTPSADLDAAQAALEAIEESQPDCGWIPKYTSLTTWDTIQSELEAHVRVIADFARFRVAVRKSTGRSPMKGIASGRLAAALPTVEPAEEYRAMLPEWFLYRRLRRAVEQGVSELADRPAAVEHLPVDRLNSAPNPEEILEMAPQQDPSMKT